MGASKLQRAAWCRANRRYRKTKKGQAANRRANQKRRKQPAYRAAAWLRTKRWRKRHPRKFKALQLRAIVLGHGLTMLQYAELLRKQRHRCALCKRRFTKNNGPVIDHNHACCNTGRSCGKCVCGIIHQKCNRGIGQLNDSSNMAKLAHRYLRKTGR